MLPTSDDKTSVRVAVRARPLNSREQANFQHSGLTLTADSQVIINNEKAFTYDYTFDVDSEQEDIFITTTRDLVDGCFDGFNATILAYGQTGSGKTYTMGTGFDISIPRENLGIVPRAVERIFEVMEMKTRDCLDNERDAPLFDVMVQFVELYNDELVDLLDRASRGGQGKRPAKPPRLTEDKFGNVVLADVCVKAVKSQSDILDWLKQGALARTTGSTNMNAQSSRSHAIFTITIKQTIQDSLPGETVSFRTTTAKFHFVDLAGSERLKRTKATGARQKEGISINSGLLALGNVISKLGDKSLKATHIPYRESKLTRLLQDSLGGNSKTVMIACVSPAADDFCETLTTLKYANRARNIQNKVVSNQDSTGQAISALRFRVLELEGQLLEFQQGKRQPAMEAYNDMFHENNALQKENEELKLRLRQSVDANMAMKEELAAKSSRCAELRAEVENIRANVPRGDGGNSDGPDVGSNPNLADDQKMMELHYSGMVEDLEAKLRKANEDNLLLRGGSLSGSPRRISSGSGSSTFRVQRRTFAVAPGSGDRPLTSSAHYQLPTIDGSPGGQTLDFSEEGLIDDDDEVMMLDEQIRLKEEEMENIKTQMASQRENYEAKIEQLQTRIHEVEREQSQHQRDAKTKQGVDPEEVRRRDQKYRNELEELRRQLKEQHDLEAECNRLKKDNTVHTKKLSKLETEIMGMKKARCEALRKAEQESKKVRQKESEVTRHMSQKDKELQRVKKQLVDARNETQQLQHRCTHLQAALTVARRNGKTGMSDQVAGRVGGRNAASPDEGKLNKSWDEFLRYFRSVSFKRMRLKEFERQLENYTEELKGLRELARETEKKLAVAVDQKDMASVDGLRSSLEDAKSTIHFVEQKIYEVQNDASVCDESKEEYNNVDPVYIDMRFQGEDGRRFFTTKILNVCMEQREELVKEESRAKSKAAEHAILVKERNVLREILQLYMVDSPGQAKIDIADVARKNLEENGVEDLSTEDVIRGICSTPTPSMSRTSSRTKARQLTHNGPSDLLGGGANSFCGSSVSSQFSTPSTSSGSLASECYTSHSSLADMSPTTRSMPPPKHIKTNTIRKDVKRTLAANGVTMTVNKAPTPKKPVPVASSGFIVPYVPFRPINRCLSMQEMSDVAAGVSSAPKSVPSHGNSLENVLPQQAPSRVRRAAGNLDLNKPWIPAAGTPSSPVRK
ncbi:Kinesin-like protein KIF21A [Hypsibius exemplaris]|uniref:Kinesin-like protein KIF21A n=1 Tax=Hypsibius exemplaris TaxID=2072580 RepID=A0A1W0WVV3_HYPEX|nr:Kinesin-like protein KIF21A [Hypsibius exemplaris]